MHDVGLHYVQRRTLPDSQFCRHFTAFLYVSVIFCLSYCVVAATVSGVAADGGGVAMVIMMACRAGRITS